MMHRTLQLLTHLGDWLTRPNPGLTEPVARRQARLLAAFLIILTPLALLSGLTQLLITGGFGPSFWGITGAVAALSVAYGLSRTRHYRAGVLLLVTVPIAVSLVNVVANPDDMVAMGFVLLGVIMASGLLSLRELVLVAAITVAAVLLLPAVSATVALAETAGAISLVIMASALIVAIRQQLALTERDRRREMLEANERLEAEVLERQQAQERLRFQAELLDSVRESVVSTDLEGRIVYWGRGARALYGYEASEVLGRMVTLIVEPAAVEEEEARMREVIEKGVWRGRYWQRRQDGSRFWADTAISLVRDESGRAIGLIGIDRDVSAERETREALQRSLDELAHSQRLLLALSQAGQAVQKIRSEADVFQIVGEEVRRLGYHAIILQLDADDGHASVAYATFDPDTVRQVEETLGHSPAELRVPVLPGGALESLLRSLEPVYHDLSEPNVVQALPAVLGAQAQQLLALLDIGESIGAPIMAGPELEGLLFVVGRGLGSSDIPAVSVLANQIGIALGNARMYQQIERQAERLRQILDTVPAGIVLLDGDRRISLANPRGQLHLKSLSNVTPGMVLEHLGPQSLAEILGGAATGTTWWNIGLEETGRAFAVAAQPLAAGWGDQGWVLVMRETTEERAREAHQRAQERLAAVGQLAAGIAHDFSNIMAVISLYSHLVLRSSGLTAENRERLTTVSQQASRAANLIGQILDFSRRSIMEKTALEIRPFLGEFVRLLQRTLPESITVQFTSESTATDLLVTADPTRLQQAIMNLSLNARDAMPGGGELMFGLKALTLNPGDKSPVPEMRPGQWLRLTVRDTGTGIEARHLPHIFEPFFTTKPPGQGAGLGLSQVYGIVRQHDGHIDVASRIGQGTTFSLYLPLISQPVGEAGPDRDADEPLHTGEGETILVVEDEQATRQAVCDSLKSLGYEVRQASNASAALELLRSANDAVDLVLTDLVMPGMSGKALFENIQRQHPSVRVVIMTGYPLESESHRLLENGLVAWLAKPFTLARLAQVVHEALHNGAG